MTQPQENTWQHTAAEYAEKHFGYSGMVAEFPEWFEQREAEGVEPHEAVEQFAEAYDLARPGPWETWS